jgi:hypothetical protein
MQTFCHKAALVGDTIKGTACGSDHGYEYHQYDNTVGSAPHQTTMVSHPTEQQPSNTPYFLCALFSYPMAVENILAGPTGRMLGRGTIFTQATVFNVTSAYQFRLPSAGDYTQMILYSVFTLFCCSES